MNARWDLSGRTDSFPAVHESPHCHRECPLLDSPALMDALIQSMTLSLGPLAPWTFMLLFLNASGLMVWRLEVLSEKGFEGTVLGTLIMPYCSGIGNLMFAYIMGRRPDGGGEVMINSLVNNVTNLTVLIGLPTLVWGRALLGKRKKGSQSVKKARKIHRLSLLLTLTAGLFFTGALWALAADGGLDRSDGLVLIGIFLFWQVFHIFEVLKSNVRQNRSLPWSVYLELTTLLAGAFVIYLSIEGLVGWMHNVESGFLNRAHLGWLTGALMVLPNGLLALYYGWRSKPEIVFTSQVGDAHICIPLCIGLHAVIAQATAVPHLFPLAMGLVTGALCLHFLLILLFGELPKPVGWILVLAYGVFLWRGLPGQAG